MSDHFKTLKSRNPDYWVAVAILVLMAAVGYGASHYMETQGHWVTGMNNQIVWGVPHVFAILLILSASGALNIASLSSVFNHKEYKPWARASALLSVCLLVGGLLVLVLDLGRPERLIVAMTYYNFKSIFAWNIFLYIGFMSVALVYLWTLFQHNLSVHVPKAGLVAFLWRFVLTAGTGSIFGFLVARPLYDSAMIVPVFIVVSLVLGTASFILVITGLKRWSSTGLSESIRGRLCRLLGLLIALELFFVAVFHLTNLYAAEHHDVERFILLEGGVYPLVFWVGQILIGSIVPLILVFTHRAKAASRSTAVSVCALIGGISLLYVTIIGGQSYPMPLFPGKDVSSSFFDGSIAQYSPALPEWLLGLGGVALALLMLILVMRVLPFLPDDRRPTSASQPS